jgi:hypothetical protein
MTGASGDGVLDMGGNITIAAGNNTSATSGAQGGDITITSGSGSSSSGAGDINLSTGNNTAGPGGILAISTGNGTNMFNGGDITVTTGNSSGIGHGGNMDITLGSSAMSGNGGGFILQAGNGNIGGGISITSGQSTTGTGNGGQIELITSSSTDFNGGDIIINTGSSISGNGGDMDITLGNSVSGNGGDFTLHAGNASNGGSMFSGGDISLIPGLGENGSLIGSVILGSPTNTGHLVTRGGPPTITQPANYAILTPFSSDIAGAIRFPGKSDPPFILPVPAGTQIIIIFNQPFKTGTNIIVMLTPFGQEAAASQPFVSISAPDKFAITITNEINIDCDIQYHVIGII